jgi:hypothetical protein
MPRSRGVAIRCKKRKNHRNARTPSESEAETGWLSWQDPMDVADDLKAVALALIHNSFTILIFPLI